MTPLHDANQPHQSPSRPCVNERNDVFGVERSDLVIRTKQLASSNTVYIFMYSYLQLSISFPKTDTHTFLSLPLSLSFHHNYPHLRACSSCRAANQTSLTIRRFADPLSIIFLRHGDLTPPWLQLWIRGCSRSLKMAPFYRPYATFYWSAIVNIALSFIIFEIRRDIGRKS